MNQGVCLLFFGQHSVEFLEQSHGCVGCTVNDWLEIFDSYVDVFAFEKLGQMNPIVLFLFQFETVIKLVHLNVLRVVPLEDFSEDPAVR